MIYQLTLLLFIRVYNVRNIFFYKYENKYDKDNNKYIQNY